MSAVAKKERQLQPGDWDNVVLTDKMYTKLANRMYNLSGVHLPLTDKNRALLENRLAKLLRRHSLLTYEEYWTYLEEGDETVISEFISALTTNMTSFFREEAHFVFLNEQLPELAKKSGVEFRVWCAAASTGQEPYSIAMTVSEAQSKLGSTKLKMLATDIDLKVLNKAASGIYDEREIDGLPSYLRHKYMDKVKSEREECWRIKPSLNALIRFAHFNLMSPHYDFKQKFHVIFCRNVLIYFDETTKKKVIDNLVGSLASGGYLILGHSETGNVRHPQLTAMSRAIYQKA